MSISAIPQNVILQTGNGQNLLSWAITAGATGYPVYRSTDGVNFTLLATAAVNYYMDATVVVGTSYFYRVASTSSQGTSGLTPSQPVSITPCGPGEINLGYLRYESQLRADQLKSNFVTVDEWNLMINQSARELYGVLVQKFGEDYFLAPPLVLQSSGQLSVSIPNGQNYLQINGIPDPTGTPAVACFKVYGMDYNSYGAQVTNTQGWVPMSRFNWADRNKYNLILGAASNNVSGQYCQFQFREMGSLIYIIPSFSGQWFRLWYVPLVTDMLLDSDMMPYSYSGWHEYVIADVSAKALAKQERFEQAQELMARKAMLLDRIESEAANRDVGQPNTMTNSRSMLGDPNFGGGGGFGGMGGWGSGGGFGY